MPGPLGVTPGYQITMLGGRELLGGCRFKAGGCRLASTLPRSEPRTRLLTDHPPKGPRCMYPGTARGMHLLGILLTTGRAQGRPRGGNRGSRGRRFLQRPLSSPENPQNQAKPLKTPLCSQPPDPCTNRACNQALRSPIRPSREASTQALQQLLRALFQGRRRTRSRESLSLLFRSNPSLLSHSHRCPVSRSNRGLSPGPHSPPARPPRLVDMSPRAHPAIRNTLSRLAAKISGCGARSATPRSWPSRTCHLARRERLAGLLPCPGLQVRRHWRDAKPARFSHRLLLEGTAFCYCFTLRPEGSNVEERDQKRRKGMT
jgi:hypothetical protein